jgi:hypothetical protein
MLPCKQPAGSVLVECKYYEKDVPMWEHSFAPTVEEAVKLSTEGLVDVIGKATSKAALTAILEHENERTRPRVTIVKACNNRLEYLTKWKEIPGV